MDKYDELCERLMGMPSVMAMRDAAAAVRELKARLEIDPRHSIDGIAARDETIRMLEAKVAERDRVIQLLTNKTGPNSPASKCVEAIERAERAEAELAKVKAHAEAMAKHWEQDDTLNVMAETVAAYRADFREAP